jgi:acyl transferase domain-containing protein/thioesterase domain-containing protein/acyl carrier protein
MSELAQRLAGLSPAQRQLLEKRLAESTRPTAEPIAIVGMACRFPGAPDLAAYWQLIRDGVNAAREVPAERWNPDEFYDPTGETPGKMSVRWAALVEGHDQFDPQFFGITPREAARMDPQQRLLLEVAWEAMENAGRPADQMAGSRTGVFVGIGGTDYSKVCVPYADYFQHIDAHMGTGNALSIASNRLSYIFDFHGPSASVDTACSSSSLAIHLAVESLRRGESDAALAGGANMILTPETTIAFSKAKMLSPRGVCRPFDAGADGYVRGEGCGLVFLKRLADAERDGDNVLAVIRSTSVNQDGRTSGISAPNSRSQIDCIRAALKQAGLTPRDIDYVEAHGTGTPLGDPIEMQALSEIFRSPDARTPDTRSEIRRGEHLTPCYVASVKANVGHMETVSGVAGLIKVVLMMQHETIARQTHFEQLNPHISLAGTRLAIPTENLAWPAQPLKRPRRAGVSSFGFGGTNTHLIIEAGPASSQPREAPAERPVHLLKLSGKSEAAVRRQAEQITAYLDEQPDASAADLCWSLNTGRSDFNHRAAIIADSNAQLRTKLGQLAIGEATSVAGLKLGAVRALTRPKVAFLFTGQGLQYPGMGRPLYESQPIFRDALDQCDEILSELWDGESLIDVLFPSDGGDRAAAQIHQTQYTQPSLFALEYALAELWRSWGVTPDMVLGHSVGEYAAACVAGAMSLEDGLALIAQRARLMQSVKQVGRMAVVMAAPDRVTAAIEKVGGRVVVAVLNGPENTVISGDADAVERLAAQFTEDGVQVKMLNVSHAFHSPLMDEMLDEFEQFASQIEFRAPLVPLAANLTGRWMNDPPTARYWRDHLRNAVQFAASMERIAEAEPKLIIEIGPTPSLLGMGRRCVPKLEAAWLPSLRQGQDDWQTIAASVAEFYVRGGRIDWRGWDQPWPRRRLSLPNYPFERTKHWYELDPSLRRSFTSHGEAASAAGAEGATTGHPLLGSQLSTVWTNRLFETRFSARSPGYLVDHRVQGSPVTPAAAYVEQGLAAAEQVFGPGLHAVANLVIQQAMFLPEGVRRRVQMSVAPESGGESSFEVYSRAAGEKHSAMTGKDFWSMHATGRLLHESKQLGVIPDAIDVAAIRDQAVSVTSRRDFYELMKERGLAYGPAFQVLDDLRRGEDAAVAKVSLPDAVSRDADRYRLHPAIGDALLQSVAGVVPLEADGTFSPFTYMPVGIRRVRIAQPIDDWTQPLFTHAKRTSPDGGCSPERVEADVCLVNERGQVLVAFEGVTVQRLGRAGAASDQHDASRWLYRVAWREAPLTVEQKADSLSRKPGAAWLVLADGRGAGQQLANELARRGETCVLVRAGDAYRFQSAEAGNGNAQRFATAAVNPLDESQYRRLFEDAFGGSEKQCSGVVHSWSLDIPRPAECPDAWKVSRRLGTGSALQLVRALARWSPNVAPPLWFVTAAAQSVVGLEPEAADDAPVAVEQSPLIGFARVAAMELPDLRPRMIDLDAQTELGKGIGELLADELRASDNEGEVAYRGARRFVSRLVRDPTIADSQADGASGQSLAVPAGRPFQLRIQQAGSFDGLRFTPVDREPPQAGQVEIEVRAAGLNFSDVLKALGLYPGIRDAIVPLGIEASGMVTAVGDGVQRFQVGDEVFGVLPYAFASHSRSAEYALAHKPKSIAHDEACTIPITFLTAYYGLVQLAQLQPGERVLIHAAAGGVGLAAIQIAQQIGADVFATAGSEEKREFLRSLGVKHIYSTRDLSFADAILDDTNREGVDVVLNSLPGEAIAKSLAILRAYGRFLEIGKTDIYQNRMIGLLPFQDNLSYFAIDLDRMLRQRPEAIRQLFAEVMAHFESGDYRPLKFTRFDAGETVAAFRYMSQRKNIGKVVVELKSQGLRAESQELDSSGSRFSTFDSRPVRSDGTYLITGGLGGLGLQIAEWMAGQGPGTIALLSRRGASPEIEPKLAAIRAKGARVVVLQGDVADCESLANAVGQLPADAPPLRGVVHAAGVLADGRLVDMTLEQLDRAMRPKVEGAWNLHDATRDAPLEFFVLFSSVASILGSPGQANYAAGNAMLDALAHARRADRLPATAINWGPWAGAGMAASDGRGEAVQSRGMALIDPEQGLEIFGRLLAAGTTQALVMDAHWDDLLRLVGSRKPALLTEIAAEARVDGGSAAKDRVDHEFRARLLEADEQGRHALVRDYIKLELGRIMGVEPAGLETDQPLSTFGLDSLLALELKNNLESRLDFTLPMAKLMEGPSIDSLAAETSRLVVNGTGEDGVTPGGKQGTAKPDAAWSPLLALRPKGSRPSLVLLPSLGGDVRCYAELVQQLGADQPVYAFRPRGVDEDLPPHATMEEMVVDYAAALREWQPDGPYFLAGWSTGGIFAHALAEKLERSGDEVALVALFDTPLPSICDDINIEDDTQFLCKLVNFANSFAGTNVRANYEQLLALPPEERFASALAEARRQGTVPPEAPEEYIRRLVKVGEANVRVIQGYSPRHINAAVHLFAPTTKGGLAEVSGREIADSGDHGWGEEVGQSLELHTVPGDHFTMMTGEGARRIAQNIDSLIADCGALR